MDKFDFQNMVNEAYDLYNSVSSASSTAELERVRDRLSEILDAAQYGSFQGLSGGVSMGDRNHAARAIERYMSEIDGWLGSKSLVRAPGAHMVYR